MTARRHTIRHTILPVLLLLLLTACEGQQQYSTQYPCSFVYYAASHPNAALTLCVGNAGQFCTVEPKTENGLTYLIMTPNAGQWTQEQTKVAMRTAIENDRLNYDRMGANRRLIIGLSNFDGLKCFDGHCPNCLVNGTTMNYPLSWTDRGLMLTCSRCQTTYNPNAQGIPTNGDANTLRLIEYRIEYNGDKLFAHN